MSDLEIATLNEAFEKALQIELTLTRMHAKHKAATEPRWDRHEFDLRCAAARAKTLTNRILETIRGEG